MKPTKIDLKKNHNKKKKQKEKDSKTLWIAIVIQSAMDVG